MLVRGLVARGLGRVGESVPRPRPCARGLGRVGESVPRLRPRPTTFGKTTFLTFFYFCLLFIFFRPSFYLSIFFTYLHSSSPQDPHRWPYAAHTPTDDVRRLSRPHAPVGRLLGGSVPTCHSGVSMPSGFKSPCPDGPCDARGLAASRFEVIWS